MGHREQGTSWQLELSQATTGKNIASVLEDRTTSVGRVAVAIEVVNATTAVDYGFLSGFLLICV